MMDVAAQREWHTARLVMTFQSSLRARLAPRAVAALVAVLSSATGAQTQSLPAAPGLDETALVRSYRNEAQAYEHGNGVPRDGVRAAALYCKAARLGDARSQYALGWMYANGRGIERHDAMAAYFFRAAAEQGLAPAEQMLARMPEPVADTPECMREAPVVAALTPPPARPAIAPPLSPQAAELRRNAPASIVDLVEQLAPQYQLQPQLVLAVIQAESNFDTLALSPKNARGLMQLIPDTAARFNVGNAFDPAQNLRGGMAYLRWLLAYFEGDLLLVTAAYNAGEGTVERYRGIPPYRETRAYVSRIVANVGTVFHPFDASVTPPSGVMRARRLASR
jgi:soluble lytic murein transglycosylase-like protein